MLYIKDSKNLFEFTDYFKSPTKPHKGVLKHCGGFWYILHSFHYKQYIQL